MKTILATVCLLAWWNTTSVNGQRQITEASSSKFGFIQRQVLPSSEVFGRRLETQPNRLARQLGGVDGERLSSIKLHF